MKKLLIAIISVVMLLSVAATFTACGDAAVGKIDVGVSMPSMTLQRWNQDAAALIEGFEKEDYTADALFANDLASRQINQIESLISRGIKVLYVSAVNDTSLNQVVAKAKSSGVKVIGYDRILTGTSDIDYFMTFDNSKVGAACAQYIVDKLGLTATPAAAGPFTIEIVGGSSTDVNAKYVYDGGMAVLEPYITDGKLVVKSNTTAFESIATPDWSTTKAMERFQPLYTTNYKTPGVKLDAVFCSNDSTAQGVAQAIANVEGTSFANFPIITGQDCDLTSCKNMVAGKQSMSVFKDTRKLAASAVTVGVKLLKGESVESQFKSTQNNGSKDVPVSFDEIMVVTLNGTNPGTGTMEYQKLKWLVSAQPNGAGYYDEALIPGIPA